MKVSKTFLSIPSVLLLLTLLLASGGALAQAPDPQSPAPQDPPPGGYVILPPMPDPDRLPLNRQHSRQEALLLAEKIRNQQLRDLRLKTGAPMPLGPQGPATLAADLSLAAALPEGAALVPEKQAEACQARYVQALSDQIWALSRPVLLREEPSADEPPFVIVYAPETSEWSFVTGLVSSQRPVYLQVLRGGNLLLSERTESDYDGSYSFTPEWVGCEGYRWKLQAGDVVKVTSAGISSTTVVAKMEAWANGSTNRVGGKTDPGRVTYIFAEVPVSTTDCFYQTYSTYVKVKADGSFTADFTSLINFDGRATFEVDAVDINGNATLSFVDAMHLYTNVNSQGIGGVMKPKSYLDISLTRGEEIINHAWQVSDADGWFWQDFEGLDAFQKGDRITVEGEGVSITLAYIPISLAPDPVNLWVNGKTDPGRLIHAIAESSSPSSYGPVINACEESAPCDRFTSDANGNFTVHSSTPVKHPAGDTFTVSVYDQAGNYTWITRGFPVLNADLSFAMLSGYWGGPEDALALTLKSAEGAVLEQGHTRVWAWDHSFEYYFNQPLLPGQKLEVTDGKATQQMTISKLTAALETYSVSLSGSAPNGRVIGLLNDFAGNQHMNYLCQAQVVTRGEYSLGFNRLYDEEVAGGLDRAVVMASGQDGMFTSRLVFPFRVHAVPDLGLLEIYTLFSEETVDIQVLRGGTILQEYTTASSNGFVRVSFDSPFLPGDVIEVSSSGGKMIEIPEMSIQLDTGKNQIVGTAPVTRDLGIYLSELFFPEKGVLSSRTLASFSIRKNPGNFTVDLNGEYDLDCNPLAAGAPCQYPSLYVFLGLDHTVEQRGATVKADQADNFEAGARDNTAATAPSYTPRSRHTFHDPQDEDWIKIQVTAEQIGKVVYLTTTQLGPTADTVLELYDTDGTTLLSVDDDSGLELGSLIEWTPLKAGAYFVRIRPANELSAGLCGSFYSFDLQRSRLALPAIFR